MFDSICSLFYTPMTSHRLNDKFQTTYPIWKTPIHTSNQNYFSPFFSTLIKCRVTIIGNYISLKLKIKTLNSHAFTSNLLILTE